MRDFKSVLVLAPHTDDGEFGCGGTIAKLVDEGAIVWYVAFSICELSVPTQFPVDILATEVKRATGVLGIAPDQLIVHRYAVRDFPLHRQEILQNLINLRSQIHPDLVFLPSSDDIHQDHQVIYNEGVRAFKQTTILGYELPWNNFTSSATALFSLRQEHITKKINALGEYESQKQRSYIDAEFIESLARVRGVQAGCEFAESFQVIRWILR